MSLKPIKIKQPQLNERRVFDFVNSRNEPVSFHKIQKSLGMSPGSLQATIKRCKSPDSAYKIYEGKKISKKNNRPVRVFSTNPNLIIDLKIPHLEDLHDLYRKVVLFGEIFEVENNFVLPLKLDEKTTKILMQLVQLSSDLKSVGDLFSKAIMRYLESNVPRELIIKAIQNINENNKLKEEN
ncbi:MAG: hypothetical protein ACTSXK_08405 [Promethearchaeota archaeon]